MYTNASQPLSIPVGALVAGPCRLEQSAPVLLVYALPRCALGITMLANRAANTATPCCLRELLGEMPAGPASRLVGASHCPGVAFYIWR